MLKRMAELGLVEHEPYHGVALTESGERVALEVIRHHRLIESYLADALDMPWDRVHDEAEVLEHYISEDLERRIAAKLGDPSRDPHGDPIPSAELDIGHRRHGVARRARAGRRRHLRPRLRPRLRDAALPRRARDPARVRAASCAAASRSRGRCSWRSRAREHALGNRLAAAMRVSRSGNGR